jgi:hypothetical protein
MSTFKLESQSDCNTILEQALVNGYDVTREHHTFEDAVIIKGLIEQSKKFEEKSIEEQLKLYNSIYSILDGMRKKKAFSFVDSNNIYNVVKFVEKILSEKKESETLVKGKEPETLSSIKEEK